MGKVSRTLTDK